MRAPHSILIIALGFFLTLSARGEKPSLHTFKRQQLSNVYFSEGAGFGDLNKDGVPDVVCGPYWYQGPDFKTKHEIYKPVPQNRERYADNFFSWVYDFNGDGWNDIFVVGFPGTPAYVYENPGKAKAGHWKKHRVTDQVSNESPHFTNIVGDEKPELVCTQEGFFGFATIDWKKPFSPWKFHRVSLQATAKRFGHGLGVGDVNGDGLMDIIHAKGWIEQPKEKPETARWTDHKVKFSNSYGGAEMIVYDVDGDGDNDIITSEAAHDFGLAWYEQVKNNKVMWKRHLIMGSHPGENRYGVVFSELHSLALADIDGDGIKDIVTGKTYYSHHKGSPMWNAGAVVYWFRLVRGKKGVDFIPYKADGEAGIGRQVNVGDLNGDGLPDIILGGMKGANVLWHKKTEVDQETFDKAQPKIYKGPAKPSTQGARPVRGPKSTLKVGVAEGALEGEKLDARPTAGTARAQPMGNFKDDNWSGNSQLWWTGAKPGDYLHIRLPKKVGTVDLELVMTCARDYGIVQLSLNDKPLDKPIDLYDPKVITTGVITIPNVELTSGTNTLSIRMLGANPRAAKQYMFGLDYLRLKDRAK